MAILEKIKRQSRIDVDEVKKILTEEFSMNDSGKTQLDFALYSTLQLILNTTNREYLIEDMFSIWVNMTKDYWCLNGYDKKYNSSNNTSVEEQNENSKLQIKSIKRGDTETTFMDNSNSININGVQYQTGTIEYDEDILLNKYKRQLYKFRLLKRKR